jgi:predicted permease
MKFALMAAVLITLPAIAGLVYGLLNGNQYLMYAALFSLGLNVLPFLVAGWMMRNASGDDMGH